eukprot:CAMPEP_0168414114 /NCGR_PEP_ID=MMETSP0228-20121227/29561_1 /TAXON_ID=133427 /ORGANISM="Protoceratium reticulatum, Strain CCCM 535 (=CCMP 1889)" /LENGTH=312 /DNA_ID=CAMNT_0008427905 /DNA_START=48 /DNA_END=986 /DNA_ORIENTATION=-
MASAAPEQAEGQGAAAEPGGAEKDFWEIEEKDIELMSLLGEGTTSIVYMAKLHGEVVCVKEIKGLQDNGFSPTVQQAVLRELRVLLRVNHPNILRFIGLVDESTPLRLVLEYCSGGSLFELLHNCWSIPLSWVQRMKVLKDTSSALNYLHCFDPPIVHRDLKSLNLMLFEAVRDDVTIPVTKLADFGLARVQERAMTQGVGTKHWMAPEVLLGTDYTEKADIFSFAMVAYEVVCRHVPFERLDPTSVAKFTKAGRRPDLQDESIVPKEVPPSLLALIVQCWDQQPLNRPSFGEILATVEEISAAVGLGQLAV